MEQTLGQNRAQSIHKKKKTKKSKIQSYWSTFMLMALGLFIVFSYVYQSTKHVILNYEIVNLNKEISNLNIKLMEAEVENERLQTNEYIEKVAAEKLGMSYDKSDRVVVVKETQSSISQESDDDKRKIKIFMKSLYDETLEQLGQFSFENIVNYFTSK